MEFFSGLQSTLDPAKPSLFELLSEQQLSGLLPPSLRYLLALATHRSPRYLLRLLNNFDEAYALLSVIVESHFLRTYSATFTEHFYALKRERVLRTRGGEVIRAQLAVPGQIREVLKLRSSDVYKNLLVIVGIPYLKRKLDEAYDVHIAPTASLLLSNSLGGPQYLDRDTLQPGATFRQRILHYYKWFLRNVYPSINAAYYFSILAWSMAYLFDGTQYSSPFLALIGTRMRRMGPADYQALEAATAALAAKGPAGRPGQGLAGLLHPRTMWPRLLSSLRFFLPTSIFALKFLEWWHASDFSRALSQKVAEGLELPPPVVSGLGLARRPEKKEKGQDGKSQKATSNQALKRSPPIASGSLLPILTVPPPLSSDLCPICLHPIETPAACQTGYVFDYKCIFQWVEGNHERQEDFMAGKRGSEWEEEEAEEEGDQEKKEGDEKVVSKEGKWESGKGRCAVTGRRILGGTGGIRRIIV